MKIIAQNKKLKYDYFLEEFFECGIVLKGTEIKSIRQGKVSINEATIFIKNEEVFISNFNISRYSEGNRFNHEEDRVKKLLLHKKQILKLLDKQKLLGYTIVCTKLYMKDGFAKTEIALAKGKKKHDKRHAIKERDEKKRISKIINKRY